MIRPFAWMLLTSLLLGAAGCGGAKEAGSGTTGTTPQPSEITPPTCEPPQEKVEPAVSPFIHHTPGDVALVLVRPSRAINNPLVTGMIKEIEAVDPSVKVADELKKMEEELGIDPKQVEYVVLSVPMKTLAAVAPLASPPSNFGPPSAPEGFDEPSKESASDPLTPDPPAEGAVPDEKKEVPCQAEPEAAVAEESTTTLEAPAESPAEDSAMPPEGLGGFEPPPSPAVLVVLNTAIDGDEFVAKMEAKEKASIEKFNGRSDSNFEGFDKEFVEQLKKNQAENLQQMLKMAAYSRSKHSGLTLYTKGESKDRLCFLNSRTILIAPEAVVKATIDRKGTPAASPLSAQLQTLVDRDFAVALDLAPVAEMSKSGQIEIPFPVMLFAAPLLKCKIVSVAADINGGNLLQVNLLAADEAGAKQLHGMLNPLLLDGIAKAKTAKDAPGQLPPEASPFLPLGEKILDGTKLTQTGDLLSLVIARPAGLEELPTLVRPMLAKAAQEKKEAAKLNDLKQIGLGMHNFHDTFLFFPSNDRGGSEAVGLSWRVHILPYVDEYPLYQEFHLDEPWDSEHNKALIPRMPKVYGTSADGKTSVHVFVGEGTPFGGEPPKMLNILDGTSNTLMVVRAGEDTADIWTKPGGLTFDKATPIAALGNIGDMFEVLFMDGSARRLPKTIAPATLGNLIQHSDGNPVELP